MSKSYRCPDPSSLHPPRHVQPRPLAPLYSPPLSPTLPSLPSPARNPAFSLSYTLTTHIVPAAYPHAPSAHVPRSSYADREGETTLERVSRQDALVRELTKRNAAQARGDVRGDPVMLWNVVNRFVRNDVDVGKPEGTRGLTLFLAHANGFPKEIWEPSLVHLFSRAQAANVNIDEVWAIEFVQHGDSATLNENVIGDVFDWADNARDILHLLLYYIPDSPSTGPLPTHLCRIPEDVASKRRTFGMKDRTLVGIGHSLGGCSVLRAALANPALFASLILVDPVVVPRWARGEDSENILALGAIRRRSNWCSREEALMGFRKSPFFLAWDPAVLETYVKYGLGADPQAGSKDAVRLKMTGVQEAIVFIDRRVCYETWQLLPQLEERIEIRFLLSGNDNYATGGDEATRELVWRRTRNVSNVRIASAGHLIPQEAPRRFAEEVVMFLQRKYESGRAKL